MKIPSWLPQHSRPLKFFPNFPVDFLDQLRGWGRGGGGRKSVKVDGVGAVGGMNYRPPIRTH
jgi:hypothetical protein